jgi:methionine-gamma-lyase
MKTTEQNIRDVQHFGEEGGVVPAVDVGATSTFLNPSDMERAFNGELAGCYLYSRHANPTVKALGSKLAAMEGTEAALGVASGMSAIHCAILQLMPEGGHVVSSASVYGGTYALFKNILPRMGVTVTFVDMNDIKAVEAAIGNDTKVLYTETMSNPLLRIADLEGLSALAKKRGLKLMVDNTFTPMIVTPAKFGADVVVHSCTKFISGASDLIGGAVCASQDFINSLIDINHGMVMLTGPIMDARIAHKLYTRLDHLGVRMIGHAKSAAFLAKAFAEEDIPVIYPGLASHKDHARMGQIMNKEFGYGGMMTVDLGTSESALKLAHRLQQEKFGLYAVSLGFSRTLMSCPSISTSSEIPAQEQKAMGLSPGLLRLSIGYLGDDATMLKRFKLCYDEVIGKH